MRVRMFMATVAVAGVGIAGALPAGATTAARHFANCTAMHKVYKGGVARVGAHDKRASGHARYRPYVSSRLYVANHLLDRDKDGVACER